jgi:hypothetical protein
MKTVNYSSENLVVTRLKDFIYSFEVLIVGVAIPFFFFFGISNGNHKVQEEKNVKEVSKLTPAPQGNVYELNSPRI